VKVIASGPTLDNIMLKTSNSHFCTRFIYTGLDIPNFEYVAAPIFVTVFHLFSSNQNVPSYHLQQRRQWVSGCHGHGSNGSTNLDGSRV